MVIIKAEKRDTHQRGTLVTHQRLAGENRKARKAGHPSTAENDNRDIHQIDKGAELPILKSLPQIPTAAEKLDTHRAVRNLDIHQTLHLSKPALAERAGHSMDVQTCGKI